MVDDRTSTIGGTYTFATGRTAMQGLSASSNRRFEGLNIIINLAATDFALVTISVLRSFHDFQIKKIRSQLDRNQVVSLV